MIWRQCTSLQIRDLYKLSEMNLPSFNKAFSAIRWIVFIWFKPFNSMLFSKVVWYSTVIECFYYKNNLKHTVRPLQKYQYNLPYVTVQILHFIYNFTSILLIHALGNCAIPKLMLLMLMQVTAHFAMILLITARTW